MVSDATRERRHNQGADEQHSKAAPEAARRLQNDAKRELAQEVPAALQADRSRIEQDHALLDKLLNADGATLSESADRSVEKFEQRQHEQVDRSAMTSRSILDFVNAALARDGHHADPVARAVLDAARQASEHRRAQMDNDQRAMLEGAAKAGPDQERRLSEAIKSQQNADGALVAEERKLRDDASRRLGERHDDRVGAQTLDAARDQVADALEPGLGRDAAQLLTDAALRRVFEQAALVLDKPAGKRTLEKRRHDAAQHVKGALAEELFERAGYELAARLNRELPADQQVEFFAGHRLRGERSKQISDGILARYEQDGALRVVAAVEIKAGAPSARALTEQVRKLTPKGVEELNREARNLALDEVAGPQGQNESVERANERRRIALKTKPAEVEAAKLKWRQELLKRSVQREPGQMKELVERLDTSDSIKVDGHERRIVTDRARAEVYAVVLEDVRRQMDAERLVGVTQHTLSEAARRVVEIAEALERQ